MTALPENNDELGPADLNQVRILANLVKEVIHQKQLAFLYKVEYAQDDYYNENGILLEQEDKDICLSLENEGFVETGLREVVSLTQKGLNFLKLKKEKEEIKYRLEKAVELKKEIQADDRLTEQAARFALGLRK